MPGRGYPAVPAAWNQRWNRFSESTRITRQPNRAACEVIARVRASGWDQCIVVNGQGIVLGRLGRKALAADDRRSVEEAMSAGPSTIRPNVRLAELQSRLERQGLRSALVTTNEGRLIGVVRRDAAAP
jgi:CBS domain-containing protein